jgi:uncharacterized OB-fold protein
MRKEYALNLDYSVALGEAYSQFMHGLQDKKFMANRCTQCQRLYAPVRPFCDLCCQATGNPFEIDPTGKVVTYTVYNIKTRNLPDPPFVQGIIKVGEAANSFLHFLGGIEHSGAEDLQQKLKIGMKVQPVWSEQRSGDILDIAYFEPVDA